MYNSNEIIFYSVTKNRMKRRHLLNLFLLLNFFVFNACGQNNSEKNNNNSKKMDNLIIKPENPYYSNTDHNKINISDDEWKKVLSPDLYAVSRNADTERAFTGNLWNSEAKGTYFCAACGNNLFESNQKFISSCGWPSFFEQKNKESIVFKNDNSFGMQRLEALCGRCGGHLGHLFDDGPEPTGKRYCMNSIALDFVPNNKNVASISEGNLENITLAGGCYWCVEAVYEQLDGVKSVESGFSGGTVENPTYKEVCQGDTGHAEVVQIIYDNKKTNLDEILKVFFTVHDPTTLNRQGEDIGTQYRSSIFYNDEKQKQTASEIIKKLNAEKVYPNPIVTKLEKLEKFYKAEDYHQNYYQQNQEQGYCKMVIRPKLEKFEKIFKDRLKKNN